MHLVILSDIHANLCALRAVLHHCSVEYGADVRFIHLGDCIDYGMRPNEVIHELTTLSGQLLVNIKGNHEMALDGVQTDRFSSPRGKAANDYTKRILSNRSRSFIAQMRSPTSEFVICGRRILCVHGDLSDPFWGTMPPREQLSPCYSEFDYVLTGHTHLPALCCRADRKVNRHTAFINPGSVGQPRNGNPAARYAVLNPVTGALAFHAVSYDVRTEQSFFNGEIDPFYRDRLSLGL